MPASPPLVSERLASSLHALGQQIRAQRKALRVSATAAAQAAGMSRVTLHRIEHGEPSVTIGAYMNAAAALGLELGILRPAPEAGEAPQTLDKRAWIPVRIRLADYPQLKRLAWQVHGTDSLTPVEARDIYERNARHLDATSLDEGERDLMEALRTALGPRVASV